MIAVIREWVVAITRTVRIASVAVTTTGTVIRADTIRIADMEAPLSTAIMEGLTTGDPTGAEATMETATMKEKTIAAETMAVAIAKNAHGGIAQATKFHHGSVMKTQKEEGRETSLIAAKDLATTHAPTNVSRRISMTD
jgi:hypothetical protein